MLSLFMLCYMIYDTCLHDSFNGRVSWPLFNTVLPSFEKLVILCVLGCHASPTGISISAHLVFSSASD